MDAEADPALNTNFPEKDMTGTVRIWTGVEHSIDALVADIGVPPPITPYLLLVVEIFVTG